MKAAVIHDFGDTPSFEDFADPVAGPGDLELTVRASALENFDRMTAAGTHYASHHLFPEFPAVVGHGGVGLTREGKLVAFGGVQPPYGCMAERAVVPAAAAQYLSPVPEGVEAPLAAALPASALTSLLPLRFAVRLRPGAVVLVNGGTGVSGKLAVQIAKLLGAGRVVATGRNPEALAALPGLGADLTVDLGMPERDRAAALAEAVRDCDVALDFLWGHPTELLLHALVPSQVGFPTHRTRWVQIGQAAGAEITLPADRLRTSGLELVGVGPMQPDGVADALAQVWDWAASGKLRMDLDLVPLRDVAAAWNAPGQGRRTVIVP